METTTVEAVATRALDDPASVVLSKILAMAFLGVSSFGAGMLPVCVFERLGIRRRARGAANTMLRLILNFGGGVLLCTTFLHLLPEVREGVEQLIDDNTLSSDTPMVNQLAELIMCLGFFVMYSVEELVHGLIGSGDCHAHDGDGDDHHHHHHRHHHHQHHHDENDGDHVHQQQQQQQQQQQKESNGGVSNLGYDKDEPVSGRVANYNSCSSLETAAGGKKATLSAQPEKSTADTGLVLRGFLIVGALSIHELFEGLAVGLEKNAVQVWSLTVAVACHKLVIAAYVGLQMLSDRTKPLLAHCSILLFAVTSPIGIGVGAVVSNLRDTHSVPLFSVILQGLATGTLMYVVFFEVLKPSVGHLKIKQRLLRLVFVAIGFASMLSVQLILTE